MLSLRPTGTPTTVRAAIARRILVAGLIAACLAAGHPGAARALGLAPALTTGPNPSDQTSAFPTVRPLGVTASDPEGDSLTVRFYARRADGGPPPDFTLIGLPDTQFYVSLLYGGLPAMYNAQTRWVVEQCFARNVRYLVQLGDCSQSGYNSGNPIEWMRADTAMRALENPATTGQVRGLPYGVCVGNHDQIGEALGYARSFNKFFGAARFSGREYYGGHFGTQNDNWFELFSASGGDYLVLGLDYAPAPSPFVLHWADSLLKAYPTRRGIVASHYLLEYPVGANPPAFSSQGQAVYDSLKDNPNLILMLCAHLLTEARRSDTWDGHTVHTIMANYQGRENGGNGRLRIMEFSPAKDQLRVRTYSPWLDAWEADPDSSSQFTVSCDLPAGTAYQEFGSMRVPSGATAAVPWPFCIGNATFEWYVTVNDGTSTITSPVWRLTTAEAVAPTARLMSPNGGGSYSPGEPVVARWIASDNVGVDHVDVYFSANGPAGPWSPLGLRRPNSGSYRFITPDALTRNARVKVVAWDAAENAVADISDSSFAIVAPVGVGDGALAALSLAPPAPNPARGETQLSFTLPDEADVRLAVMDVQGREVAVLASGRLAPGPHAVRWYGQTGRGRARSGRYFVRLRAGGRSLVQPFVWLR